MKPYVLCIHGTYRVMTQLELSLEVIPSGTQMYSPNENQWYILLPSNGVDIWRDLDIGGVFPDYRAMVLLLT